MSTKSCTHKPEICMLMHPDTVCPAYVPLRPTEVALEQLQCLEHFQCTGFRLADAQPFCANQPLPLSVQQVGITLASEILFSHHQQAHEKS